MLYIPGYWFHFIVSQDASIQCNSRSGKSEIGEEVIKRCNIENEEIYRVRRDNNRKRKSHAITEVGETPSVGGIISRFRSGWTRGNHENGQGLVEGVSIERAQEIQLAKKRAAEALKKRRQRNKAILGNDWVLEA